MRAFTDSIDDAGHRRRWDRQLLTDANAGKCPPEETEILRIHARMRPDEVVEAKCEGSRARLRDWNERERLSGPDGVRDHRYTVRRHAKRISGLKHRHV